MGDVAGEAARLRQDRKNSTFIKWAWIVIGATGTIEFHDAIGEQLDGEKAENDQADLSPETVSSRAVAPFEEHGDNGAEIEGCAEV